MKKFYILLLAASCILSSCNMLSKNMAEKDIAEINEAKTNALNEIKEASTIAISTAENEISSATKKSIASASEDLNSSIKEAEKSIASSVVSEVNDKISADLAETQEKIREVSKIQFVILILSIIALGAAIVAIVLLLQRTSHNAIMTEVTDSKTFKNLMSTVDNLKGKPQVQTSSRSIDFEREVKKILATPEMKHYFDGLLTLRETNRAVKDDLTIDTQQGQNKITYQASSPNAPQPNTPTYVSKVELYARDSRNLELTDVTTFYQPGKSIFKLILNSSEAPTANIEICTDKQEVLQRILQSDQDLIEPVCKVVSKVSKPTNIKWTAGRAEQVEADTWKVCEQVVVEII